MEEFIKKQKDYILISKDTPLISNLNMMENISLIKEVNFGMSIKNAQILANEFLDKIELSYIGKFRKHQCQLSDIFFVLLIRALMTKERLVIIKSPYRLLYTLTDIKNICQKIDILNSDKDILILDTLNNKMNYKETICNIIE